MEFDDLFVKPNTKAMALVLGFLLISFFAFKNDSGVEKEFEGFIFYAVEVISPDDK